MVRCIAPVTDKGALTRCLEGLTAGGTWGGLEEELAGTQGGRWGRCGVCRGAKTERVALPVYVGVILESDEGGVQQLGVVVLRHSSSGGGVNQDSVIGGGVRAGGTTRATKSIGVVVDTASPMLHSEVVTGQPHGHAR